MSIVYRVKASSKKRNLHKGMLAYKPCLSIRFKPGLEGWRDDIMSSMDKIIKEFPSFANKVYLVDLPAGRQVVVKQFLVLDAKQIRISQSVRQQLDNIIHVPQLIKNKDGDTLTLLRGGSDEAISFFEMSEYIPNTPITNQNISSQQIEEIGKILGKIHTIRLDVIARSETTKQSSSEIATSRTGGTRDDDGQVLSSVDFGVINSQVEEKIEKFLDSPHDVHPKLKILKEFIEHTELSRKDILKHDLSFYSAEKVLTH